MNIGFIGTGLLGFPMAKRVIDAGYQLIAYNRTYEKAEPLKNYGASVKTNVEDLIRYSDYIILVLSDINAINDCLFVKPDLLHGKTVIQMSTISPKESINLSENLKNYGVSYFEAPVLGSIPEAQSGKLIVMVGSDNDLSDSSKELLKSFTDEPLYIGKIGQAAALKLALNNFIANLTSAFSLSLGIVQKSEIDIDIFMNILRKSALYAPTYDKKLDKMLNNDFQSANFPTKHLLKDVNLILDTSKELNIETSMLEGVKEIITKTVSNGMADMDYSAIYNTIVNK